VLIDPYLSDSLAEKYADDPNGLRVGAITVQREDLPLADNSTSGLQVTCPAGTKIIGGGSSLDQTGQHSGQCSMTASTAHAGSSGRP
jgi:hypothetical protein